MHLAVTKGRRHQAAERILFVMMELDILFGRIDPSLKIVAFLSGHLSARNDVFHQHWSHLESLGFVETLPNKPNVSLTQAGRAIVAQPTMPTANQETHDRIRRLLNMSAPIIRPTLVRMFDTLVKSKGDECTQDDLASTIGFMKRKTMGYVYPYMILTACGLIEEDGDECIRLTDVAFPFGRFN